MPHDLRRGIAPGHRATPNQARQGTVMLRSSGAGVVVIALASSTAQARLPRSDDGAWEPRAGTTTADAGRPRSIGLVDSRRGRGASHRRQGPRVRRPASGSAIAALTSRPRSWCSRRRRPAAISARGTAVHRRLRPYGALGMPGFVYDQLEMATITTTSRLAIGVRAAVGIELELGAHSACMAISAGNTSSTSPTPRSRPTCSSRRSV